MVAPDELAAYRTLWRGGAARGPFFGSCDRCKRNRDDDGRPLLVARQERSRLFLCLGCFAPSLARGRRRAPELAPTEPTR